MQYADEQGVSSLRHSLHRQLRETSPEPQTSSGCHYPRLPLFGQNYPCGQNTEPTIPHSDFLAGTLSATARSRLTWTAWRSEACLDGQKSPSGAAVDCKMNSNCVDRESGRWFKQLVGTTEVARQGVPSFPVLRSRRANATWARSGRCLAPDDSVWRGNARGID